MTKLRFHTASALALIIFSVALGASPVAAQTSQSFPLQAPQQVKAPSLSSQTGLNETARQAGLASDKTRNLPVLIGNIIRYAMAAVGMGLLLMLIYAGYLYMTSQGNAETHKKANKIVVNAVLGLVIIVASYSLVTYLTNVIQATEENAAEPAGG